MTPAGAKLRPASSATTPEQRWAAAAAPVSDALWFLARQVQTGAFIADDGGSPVAVAVAHQTAPLAVENRPVTADLTADTEAERLPPADQLDTRTRIRYVTELFRRIADTGVPSSRVDALRRRLAAERPLRPALANPALAAVAARLPDPVALYQDWGKAIGPSGATGRFPALPGAGASRPAIERAARGWVAWMADRIAAPGADGSPERWDRTQLSYQLTMTADFGDAAAVLRAEEYDGTGLDWHSFDRSIMPSGPAAGASITVRPTPVTYPGMPERGYWAIEDGNVNLDVLAARDPARRLLVSFAHAYANDWFVAPLDVEPGATLITSVTVTDNFGTVTTVPAAAALDGPDARFRLWELDLAEYGDDEGRGLRLLLPPAPPPLQGRAVEEVTLARDEMANLGWLIELTTTDEDGAAVDRFRRWLARRAGGDASFRPSDAGGEKYYRLGTTLPDFWSPLESVPTAQQGLLGLRLAGLPPGATDVSSEGVQGLLREELRSVEVEDEEVPRSGTRISRVDRLAYGARGRRLWRARQRTGGTGEASSGLRFDTIGPPAQPANLVQNPDLALAARSGGVEQARAGRVPSLARGWHLVNTRGGHTLARLEPATRTGEGWQLHVTTSKPRSGVAQQFAPRGTGPRHVRASAWVFVVSGRVSLAAGPLGSLRPGATTVTTGRWELLEASASRSPVNQIVLLADGGPAEFIVDGATLRPA